MKSSILEIFLPESYKESERESLIEAIESAVKAVRSNEIDLKGIVIVYGKKPKVNFRQLTNEIFLQFFDRPSGGADVGVVYGVVTALLPLKLESLKLKTLSPVTLVVVFNSELEEAAEKIAKGESGRTSKKTSDTLTFLPSEPKYRLEQVILPKETKEEIETTLTLLIKRKKIYEDWGFKEIDPEPKAILNFFGPPGTGKTMTAHAIAKRLNMKILALNYADIESKYVGEAPKNLVKAFETAKKENCLLFFDEADSFLGKRITDVSSSSDQAVNSLRSQMLILLEQFDGIVVFATNLLKNYDRAFESRIFRHIKFELPDFEARKEIINVTLPKKALKEPLQEEQLSELSEISDGFSGREIKNAILQGLSIAAEKDKDFVSFDDLKEGFTRIKEQIQKLNKERGIMSKEAKKEIEDKIKKQLSLRKATLNLAALAASSTGFADRAERQVVYALAKDFGIDYDFPSEEELLELNLDEILKEFEESKDKLQAIDAVIRVIAADGEISEEEKLFLKEVSGKLGFSEEDFSRFLKVTEKLASGSKQWKELKLKLLDNSESETTEKTEE